MVYWLRVSILCLFFTSPLMAQKSNKFDDMDVDCDNAITTMDIRLCSMAAYQQADKELNEIYKKLVASYEQELQEARTKYGDEENLDYLEEPLKRLRQSQRDWIKFRDSACDFDASQWWGGTWQPVAYTGCLTLMSEQQTERLRTYLEED